MDAGDKLPGWKAPAITISSPAGDVAEIASPNQPRRQTAQNNPFGALSTVPRTMCHDLQNAQSGSRCMACRALNAAN